MFEKGKWVLFIATLLLGLTSLVGMGQSVNAEETIDMNETDGITEVTEVSREELIIEFAKNSNVTEAEAETMLFPDSTLSRFNASIEDEDSNYAILAFQDRTISDAVEGGTVYFYCETSESGWFRAIKNIIYAGYNHPGLGFKGTLQYGLPDPNRIHFTLNGTLHYRATTSVSGGGSIGVGGVSSINIGGSVASDFARNVFVNKDISF